MEYTFTLKYQLADDKGDMDALVERLGEAGCDDALVGIGQPGCLALAFTREAADAQETVRRKRCAARWPMCAAPSARLIEVAPDLVGLTDVAKVVGVSRQNLMLAYPGSFPAPVHEGSASIWHLADVLAWLQAKGSHALAKDVLEVASVALKVNVAKERRRLPRATSKELEALVG